MHVTLVDDTIPFDGNTPAVRPLGGVEKAFASLAGALAERGHDVHVYNRAPEKVTVDGAVWETWEAPPPSQTDVLIAYRKPSLLGFVPEPKHRLLWVAGDGDYLGRSRNRARLHLYKPVIVFLNRRAMDGWENEDRLRVSLIAPGVRYVFRHGAAPTPADPPRAIVTCYPLRGLAWLIDLWSEKIHPISPRAEMHVYSAVLDAGVRGEHVHASFETILEKARGAADEGVVIKRPLADAEMVQAYRAARVHLYPSSQAELYCYTLAESQASGLPAVSRPRGGARDSVIHDTTGFLVDKDDAFANAALRVLNDQKTYERLSLGGRAMQRDRDWDTVASEFEAFWA